jgi:hypothetical protein
VRNKPDFTVLGFTSEETKRADRFRLTERDSLITPLIDIGYTKQDCFDILLSEGINLPNVYLKGFPNANCIGCVKATSATYWNLVRKEYPDVFSKRVETSDRTGAKLAYYKGERVKLSDLPEDAVGRKLSSFDFECGIFCEENPDATKE